jgi:peptide/nickel transport system substrate-binding protein
MRGRRCRAAALLTVALIWWMGGVAVAAAETVLRAVMHSDLNILDPIWTTAYIVRDHGYMIYDTLFAMDAQGAVRPQMVDRYEVSADKLTYTLTLRDGLLWHDGKPVTSEDCIASIKRWAGKDSLGQKMLTFVKDFQVVSPTTFKILLKEPTGLVIQGLGKPSSNVPFMMPRRVAETDVNTRISEFIGSGPFVFKGDEWTPGAKTVYVKFASYRPRAEAPSGLAGGKVAKVDRVEWKWIPDARTRISALIAGEVDYVESPPYDRLRALAADPHVTLMIANPLGNQFAFRFNTLHRPFDNARVRQAVFYAFNQEDFLKATVGDPKWYKVCRSMWPCLSPLATTKGMDGLLESNFERSRVLLKEAGYDGTPIVLMQSTDIGLLTNLAPVAKSLMEKGGFSVDMQSMDWQTLIARRAKKDPPGQGGWHAFLTSWVSADVLNPVTTGFLNASCEKAMVGWPCDKEIERLRDQFARETSPAEQKAIAEAVQVRVTQYPTHIHLGQWYGPVAIRKNIGGVVEAPAAVFWNVEKK